MAKKVNAINNSTRNTVLINYGEKLISGKKKSKKKKLLEIIKSNSGRNNQGKITTRHKGGRHKRYYRIIDFKRYSKDGIEGKIESIEYDPNRNCFISLVSYNDGSFSFILSPEGVKLGDKIVSGESDNIPIKPGNNLPLSLIPVNTPIHNLEMKPKKGGELIRSAGSWAEIIGKEEGSKYVLVRLMSKEVRKILSTCRATVGKVGNGEFNLIKLGKAGRNRWRGVRPTVRGSAMNPIDHPHGGGEQKAGIGRPSPLSPWGKKTLGKKTRKKNKISNKYIVHRRKK